MEFRSAPAWAKTSFLPSPLETQPAMGRRISFFSTESAKATPILFLWSPIFSFCAELESASGWKKSF
jgi:hypothetical protein